MVQMPLVVEPVVEPVVASPTDDVDVRSGGVEMPHAASFEHVSSKFLGFILVQSSCGKGRGGGVQLLLVLIFVNTRVA